MIKCLRKSGSHLPAWQLDEVNKKSLEEILSQLKCHFTWNLFNGKGVPDDLEGRVCEQIEYLDTKFKATMYNLLAYIKHLGGQDEAALKCLQQAEELIQREYTSQAEIRTLATWGNYAWVYYHLDRYLEAQKYVDKVKQVCEKFSNPYSTECPELDCEEGWTRLQCGGKQTEKAKVCFEKALLESPNNPEFVSGLAIAKCYLDSKPQKQLPFDILKQAVALNPENQYIKVLLALKLQKMSQEDEGEELVDEALQKAPGQPDVLRSAAKFYKKKGDLDKAIELLTKALETTPNNGFLHHQIACYYREKIKQVENAGESETSGNREKVEELRKCAQDYCNKATEKGLSPLYALSDITELLETEECFQIAASQKFPDTEREQVHTAQCNVQEYHGESEDTAVQDVLGGLSTSNKPTEKAKVEYQLQEVAVNPLPQNAPNYWYHQGLIHKMGGDLLQAAQCYEKELGRLLRNSPSGISSFFLSASELEEVRAEVGPGTGSSSVRQLPNP